MKEHEFTIILASDPDEEKADSLYGIISDGTLSTIEDVPQIRFHRMSTSLEEAIRSAIKNVKSAGVGVLRVEIEPEVMGVNA